MRFVQLARLAGLTQQTTVVTEDGRPLAAIVPVEASRSEASRSEASRSEPEPPGPAVAGRRGPAVAEGQNPAAAGWIRRIDKLRAEFRHQHVGLEQALEEVWRELDKVRPAGADREIDALRAAHTDLRRPRSAG